MARKRISQSAVDHRHPLDPLSEAELVAACDILKSERNLGPTTRFGFVQLEEPARERLRQLVEDNPD